MARGWYHNLVLIMFLPVEKGAISVAFVRPYVRLFVRLSVRPSVRLSHIVVVRSHR